MNIGKHLCTIYFPANWSQRRIVRWLVKGWTWTTDLAVFWDFYNRPGAAEVRYPLEDMLSNDAR